MGSSGTSLDPSQRNRAVVTVLARPVSGLEPTEASASAARTGLFCVMVASVVALHYLLSSSASVVSSIHPLLVEQVRLLLFC